MYERDFWKDPDHFAMSMDERSVGTQIKQTLNSLARRLGLEVGPDRHPDVVANKEENEGTLL